MSTERSFVVKSIRRIALSAPALRQAMDDIQARGDQPASVGVGTSDTDRDRLCCDGSTSSNPNPGVDERDTSDGQEGLDSGDPADISDMGGGCLSGVTDCATGEPVCFCGDDWIPPEGWDGPTDPPVDESYNEGSFWTASEFEEKIIREPTLPMFTDAWVAAHSDKYAFVDCGINECGDFRCYAATDTTDPGSCGCGNIWDGVCYIGGGRRSPHLESCDGHEEQGYCNPSEEDILAREWPEDGCTNLAIKSGTIVGSKYDPENDGSYSTPMDEIPLCDEFGNQFWLRPSSTGGWKTIDVNKEAGYLWDKQGNKIAHINGAEYSDPDV